MASIGMDPVSGATIETDQDDYVPGQLVHVTGHGWGMGETVHLFMTEDPDTHGDVTQDVQADSSGAFGVPFYDVQDHDLGVTFTLTATGQTSGDSATTVFTDSRTVNSYTLNGTTFIFPPPPPSNPPASNPITVSTGSSVAVVANVTTTGLATGTGNGSSLWLSTSVEVKPASGSFTQILCDEADVNTGNGGTFSYAFSFTAPAAGTYDVRVRAWASNGCSSNAGDRTYPGALIVTGKANQTISFGALGGKTYGDAPFTVSATATSGLPVSFSTTSATCSVAGNTVAIQAAGSCTVRASQAGNTSFNAAPDVDQSFTIARAAVTAMAGGGAGTYDGAPQIPAACTVSGPFTGDLSCANSPATVGPDAGTSTISPVVSGTGLGNFTITALNGSYTISQAHVTATAGSGSGTYNSSTQTPSACAVTGAYTGNLACSNLPGVVGPDAGTTTITPGVSGTGLTNFDISLVNGSYTIAKASVTATAGGGSGTYNGGLQSPAACVVSGDFTGDLTCANNPISVGPGVGTTTIAAQVSGTGLDNFEISPIAGSYTISKALVTATAGGGSAMYNGLTHAPSSCAVTGTFTGNLFCTNAPAAVGPDAGTIVINPAVSGENLDNFDITPVAGSYEIEKAPVTVTAGSGSGTYSGSVQSPSACTVTATVSGGYTGDLTCANDPASVGPNVGTFPIAPVVSGTGLTNFAITPANGSYTISQAPVTATAGSGSSTYDGNTHAPAECAVTGVYTRDLTCANGPASVGPNVGTFPIAPVVSGTGLTNFAITPANGSYTISQAPVTATAGSGSATYNGGTHSPAACAVTGPYTGTLSCTNQPTSVGPNAGTSTITPDVSGPGQANFDISLANGSYTIDRKTASVTPDPKSKFFGAADPVLTGTLSGFLAADNVTASYSRVPGENVGTYTISATLAPAGVLGNYDVTYKTSVFTIMAWTLTGFYQPVDMPSPSIVWNTVKNGSTVPLKFNVMVGGEQRTDVGAVRSFASYSFACNATSPTDDIEFTTTGGTVLRYDATAGQFIQNWQTPKLAGQCFRVVMTTLDASTLVAYFKLK
jgi:hypothetical protein